MITLSHDIADLNLADVGRDRISWSELEMPVLRSIREQFAKEKPFEGHRIATCLNVTAETANLLITLKAGGAEEVSVCANNFLSTQDDVAAALVKHYSIQAFCKKGEDYETYYRHIHRALDIQPTLTIDDGADTVTVIHNERRELIPNILGGTEETTTGIHRLNAMVRDKALMYPVIAVNDAKTKCLFDNRYGTGQSTIDGILRATNLLIAGRTIVVAGYGWCGRGVAMRAKGLGAQVIITEIDPTKALEAALDGFVVTTMDNAASLGDLFITNTGNKHVITTPHFEKMKDGAIVCNSGHFNVEVEVPALEKLAVSKRPVRQYIEEYTLPSQKRIFLLCEGKLVNLISAEGNPAAVMDMSFSNQALCLEYLVKNAKSLEKQTYPVPVDIDQAVASLKLKSLGIVIDSLTPEQIDYLTSWNEGT